MDGRDQDETITLSLHTLGHSLRESTDCLGITPTAVPVGMPGCTKPGPGGAGARQFWVTSSDGARARVSATVVHASRVTERSSASEAPARLSTASD